MNCNEVLTGGCLSITSTVLHEEVACWGHGTTTAKFTWCLHSVLRLSLKVFPEGRITQRELLSLEIQKKYLSLCQPWLFFATFQEFNIFFYHLQNYLCLNPVTYSLKKKKRNLYFHKPGQPFRNAHLYFPWAIWSDDCIWRLKQNCPSSASHCYTDSSIYLRSTPFSPS